MREGKAGEGCFEGVNGGRGVEGGVMGVVKWDGGESSDERNYREKGAGEGWWEVE